MEPVLLLGWLIDTMHGLLIDVDSFVLEHGLQSVWASVVMAHRLSCPMACARLGAELELRRSGSSLGPSQ